MASKTAKAAHRSDGGDLRNSQSGRADGSENRRYSDQTQPVVCENQALTLRPAAALSEVLPDRQVRWLVRRLLISPSLATAIAPLAFPEARA
jgi:hypothetical protein